MKTIERLVLKPVPGTDFVEIIRDENKLSLINDKESVDLILGFLTQPL